MPFYAVEYENTAFLADDSLDGIEFTECEAAGFSETAQQEGTLPHQIKAVLGGQIFCVSADLNKSANLKHYVVVRLLVEAESEDDAEAISPPKGLLATITDAMSGETSLELNGTWKISNCEIVEATPSLSP